MRFAYAPFTVLGITFIALGSGGKPAFLVLGILFLVIAAVAFLRLRRS